jgi:hypothetical protein
VGDDNIIWIDGRLPDQLYKDHQDREKREKLRRKRLKRIGLELWPENAPGGYRIAQPQPPQPEHPDASRDLSLDQMEDATSNIDIREGQTVRGGLRTATVGKPWRQQLPQCHLNRLEELKKYYDDVAQMRLGMESFRDELSNPENSSYRHLSQNVAAALVLLECAEMKLFHLLPIEEIMSPKELSEMSREG